MVRTRLNIGCRYSTPVRKRPLHPTRSQFKPEASQTQAPVTPATEPERRAGGGLTTVATAIAALDRAGRAGAVKARLRSSLIDHGSHGDRSPGGRRPFFAHVCSHPSSQRRTSMPFRARFATAAQRLRCAHDNFGEYCVSLVRRVAVLRRWFCDQPCGHQSGSDQIDRPVQYQDAVARCSCRNTLRWQRATHGLG